MPILTKTCNHCTSILPIEDFAPKQRNRDGYENNCRACNRLKDREYRVANKHAKPKPGNSVAERAPHLIRQWDEVDFSPYDISWGSGRQVNWKCEKGHKWTARVDSRTGKSESKCPLCFKASKGSIGTHKVEWQAWLSQPTAESVMQLLPSSSKPVLWVCPEKQHEFTLAPRRFNLECPTCLLELNSVARKHPELVAEWSSRNEFTPDQVSYNSARRVLWECQVNDAHAPWETPVYQRVNGQTKCPQCSIGYSTSVAEREVAEFLTSLGIVFTRNDRSIIAPLEVDIYVPQKQIAIEYNGLYWHSEAQGKGKHYHYNKWKACQDAGIQLITIWEDEWRDRQEVVKSMLSHKLGVSSVEKVFARKTTVETLTQTQVNEFLEATHIQGSANGSLRYGLIDATGNLVCVMVFKHDRGRLNLLRFATSALVPGGFSKMLKYVERTFPDKEILTFSDHQVSDGGLYRQHGFVADLEIPVDYSYVSANKTRVHKFNYRLKRFRDDERLIWEEGRSERELALLNNIPRIWDSGKTRWVKPATTQ